MSRIASQALGGYFKTQDAVRPLIYRRFTPVTQPGEYCVVDPCAGEGEALCEATTAIFGTSDVVGYALKKGTRPEGVKVSVVAVELEQERSQRAVEAVRRVTGYFLGDVKHGDGLCCDYSGIGASLLWLNPPYDFFRGQRFERRFLLKWVGAVTAGGSLVLIVPDYVVAGLADVLLSWFDDLEVLQYPEPEHSEFGQVVVLGTKRATAAATEDHALPATTLLADAPARLRTPPPGSVKVDTNAVDVRGILASTPAWCGQAGYDRPATPPRIGLAMRPKPVHVAMALGCGVFNGVRLTAAGQPDILAKAVFVRSFVDVKGEDKHDADGKLVRVTQVEKPKLTLTTLNLEDGTYAGLDAGTTPTEQVAGAAPAIKNFADLLLVYGDAMVSSMRDRCPSLHDVDHDVALPVLARPLYPAQHHAAVAALKLLARGETPLILGEIGSGKCLRIGTLVMLHNGRRVPVEEVQVGDSLMGPDSYPRKILSTTRGRGPLYKVVPTQGEPWVCNDAHILTLVHTMSNDVVDVNARQYASVKRLKMSLSKGNRTTHPVTEFKQFFPEGGVSFPEGKPLPVDPYFLGVWCGDGRKDLTCVSVTKPDREIRDLMETTAAAWGLKVRINCEDRCPTYTLTKGQDRTVENCLLKTLRQVIGDGTELPHSYLTASRTDRQAFLAG